MENLADNNKFKVKEETKKNGYLSLIKEKNFIIQTLANAVSRFGDGIDTIAFAILIYKITGSTLIVATLFAVNGLPNLIFGMVSGVFCKYISDKKIIALADFGRFLSIALISLLYITGNLDVWHLYVITFLNSSFESFRAPASTSIIPKIIPMEKIEYGMAFTSTSSKTTELIGLGIAPFIISIVGIGGAIFIDALTFLICGLLVLSLKVENTLVKNKKLTVRNYIKDLKEGFIYIRKDGLILNIIIFAAIVNALVVPFNSLQAPYVKEVLKIGNTALSVMSISVLIGITVTTIFAPKIKEKIGNKKMFILGGIIIGLTYSILAFLGGFNKELIYILLAVDTFILGIGSIFVNFPLQIVMMKKVPREYLPRVAATFNAVALCAVPVTAFIIGIISQFITIQTLFTLFGIGVALIFIMQILNKVMNKYDEC